MKSSSIPNDWITARVWLSGSLAIKPLSPNPCRLLDHESTALR
jgi:hypothetical protein